MYNLRYLWFYWMFFYHKQKNLIVVWRTDKFRRWGRYFLWLKIYLELIFIYHICTYVHKFICVRYMLLININSGTYTHKYNSLYVYS